MGCDIHIYAEIKTGDGWEKVGAIFPNPYFDITRPSITDDDGYVWNAKLEDEPYSGRNYDLFALLADVRNYDEIDPIDYPRGLPDDVSDKIAEISNDYGADGHSHSWYLLSELIEYAKDNLHVAKELDDFFENTIENLKKLSDNPDDVRVIFWFDN
jgi:hypothetical protein